MRHLQRSAALQEQVPPMDNPLSPRLPRGTPVLIVTARAGYALTPDVIAKWQHQSTTTSAYQMSVAPTTAVTCPFCTTDSHVPTIRCRLWDCDGLRDILQKYLPAGVTTLEERTTQTANKKATFVSGTSLARPPQLDLLSSPPFPLPHRPRAILLSINFFLSKLDR